MSGPDGSGPARPLAHSVALSGPNAGRPQEYADHADAVPKLAGEFAAAADAYNATGVPLAPSAIAAGCRHDLGKLDPANQGTLRQTGTQKQPLARDHVDAAVASLWDDGSQWAAFAAAAHHKPGLASLRQLKLTRTRRRNATFDEREALRELRHWRLSKLPCDRAIKAAKERDALIAATQTHLARYEAEHAAECGPPPIAAVELEAISPRCVSGFSGLPTRLLLSCLVDADHSDTAGHGSGWTRPDPPAPRWDERIAALETYLGACRDKAIADRVPAARIKARDAFARQCAAAADSDAPIVACEGPVGIGKTTAVVGYLLRVARRRGLRRLVVVAPYTAIIDQTVDTLRKALTLDGERAEEIVAAHHSRIEFDEPHLRDLAQLWTAPIVVTTAVQFFETLAASTPAGLRKLHALPGSAIMLDESHAALRAPLWPLGWDWLRRLGAEWGCRIVMASGTLVRLWNLDGMQSPNASDPPDVPLIAEPATAEAKAAEATRIHVATIDPVLSPNDLLERVIAAPGPRLVILNTTQSAAAFAQWLTERAGQTGNDIADDLPEIAELVRDPDSLAQWSRQRREWRSRVFHLSTLLCPDDRGRVLAAIRARLRQGVKNADEADWTVVATSCIEAGVDVSFRTGFREAWSVASLLQTAGRINRGSEYDDATLWSFTLRPDAPFNTHPAARQSAIVLRGMFDDGELTQPFDPTEVATEALSRELRRTTTEDEMKKLPGQERAGEFPKVAEGFRVIDSLTKPVLVDAGLIRALRDGEKVGWSQIARGSVGLTSSNIERLGIEAEPDCRGLPVCEDYDRNLLGLGGVILAQVSNAALEPQIV